jgi:hypothetical protein
MESIRIMEEILGMQIGLNTAQVSTSTGWASTNQLFWVRTLREIF